MDGLPLPYPGLRRAFGILGVVLGATVVSYGAWEYSRLLAHPECGWFFCYTSGVAFWTFVVPGSLLAALGAAFLATSQRTVGDTWMAVGATLLAFAAVLPLGLWDWSVPVVVLGIPGVVAVAIGLGYRAQSTGAFRAFRSVIGVWFVAVGLAWIGVLLWLSWSHLWYLVPGELRMLVGEANLIALLFFVGAALLAFGLVVRLVSGPGHPSPEGPRRAA